MSKIWNGNRFHVSTKGYHQRLAQKFFCDVLMKKMEKWLLAFKVFHHSRLQISRTSAFCTIETRVCRQFLETIFQYDPNNDHKQQACRFENHLNFWVGKQTPKTKVFAKKTKYPHFQMIQRKISKI